jgi:hypothetical protein
MNLGVAFKDIVTYISLPLALARCVVFIVKFNDLVNSIIQMKRKESVRCCSHNMSTIALVTHEEIRTRREEERKKSHTLNKE